MAMFDPHTKEQAAEMVETTGIWGQRGEERSVLTVFLNGKAAILPYMGVPTRLIATAEGGRFTVSAETAGRPNTLKRIYELSADGQTLTLNTLTNNNGKEAQSTIVLLQAAGFRRPAASHAGGNRRKALQEREDAAQRSSRVGVYRFHALFRLVARQKLRVLPRGA